MKPTPFNNYEPKLGIPIEKPDFGRLGSNQQERKLSIGNAQFPIPGNNSLQNFGCIVTCLFLYSCQSF